jgi:hypothetical protein
MAHATSSAPILLLGALACALPACGNQDAEKEQPGAVGAHVWLPTSVALDISSPYFYEGYPPGRPPVSGTKSASWNSAELSHAQVEWLAGLVLIPIDNQCTADGYSYVELVIFAADGTNRAYRTTGCDHLRIEGATAMLPELSVPQSFWK